MFRSFSTNVGFPVVCPIAADQLALCLLHLLPIIPYSHIFKFSYKKHIMNKATEALRLLGVLVPSHFGAVLDCLNSKLWCCNWQLSQSV